MDIHINGKKYKAVQGETILEVAVKNGIKIPTLCYHSDLCLAGNCRICVVDVDGAKTLQASCTAMASNGMKIWTNTPKVIKARKMNIQLLLGSHFGECYTCPRNSNCELLKLAEEHGIEELPFPKKSKRTRELEITPSLTRDPDKCIMCGRCVRTCEELQGVHAVKPIGRSNDVRIETFFGQGLMHTSCTMCGQCINRCPTGALYETSCIQPVWDALADPDKYVVVQTAPAVRAALGEEFGMEPGTRVTGKMVAALRKLGFNKIFDTQFTADLTIIEEGTEFLTRLKRTLVGKEKGLLPMTTSCSPGWVKYIEHFYPDLLTHVSTCKSPQQMFGPLAKTYFAEKEGINPSKMLTVSIMPCVAKKYEADRPEMNASGYKDVDYVLTTRELAKMMKTAGLDLKDMPVEEYDNPFGISTGAAVIFGATGGVMEAALRTVYEIVTGREVPFKNLDITPVRGMEDVKEAEITIEGVTAEYKFLEGAKVRVAVAHSLGAAKKVMDKVKSGEADYHFIEIMACPGGCLGGGGQPIPTSPEIRKARARAIYEEDESMAIRKSHDNPAIKKLYEDFLEKPNSHKAHELLHTHYLKRKRFDKVK
ncbi:MAG: NADH-dependent [FeFe] hydrogenase, group A6 [bacterium]|nr:NADH-dependent [FeFe] hydrogenase, group A6 [bacterium]